MRFSGDDGDGGFSDGGFSDGGFRDGGFGDEEGARERRRSKSKRKKHKYEIWNILPSNQNWYKQTPNDTINKYGSIQEIQCQPTTTFYIRECMCHDGVYIYI